jgi:hypothetical protein
VLELGETWPREIAATEFITSFRLIFYARLGKQNELCLILRERKPSASLLPHDFLFRGARPPYDVTWRPSRGVQRLFCGLRGPYRSLLNS